MREDISERMKTLSPEKLALLVRKAGHQQQSLPLRRLERDSALFDLSFAQQRLWFLDQLVPASSAYNVPIAIHMQGKLHITALEKSLNEIIRRHEVLRTTFIVVNNQPKQVIAPVLTLSLVPMSLEQLPEAQREERVRQVIQDEATRPFDLARGPLVRACLLKLTPEEHVFILMMHHITSDGWSIGILVRELTVLYEAFLAGKPSPLPELPIQYVDFARWQRSWLQGRVLEEQLAYWRQQLAGVPPTLDLPTDHPRPAVQTFRGERYFFDLEKPLVEKLKALSAQEQITLFMTLLTGFKILLARYTGQEKIVVGSAIANRNQVEIEGLIGFFVNILILATDLGGNPSVRQALQTVKEVTSGAYAHQDLPFEKIVEELQTGRDMSRMPLCQVSFALQNAPRPKTKLTGLTLTHLGVQNKTAKFDLTLDTTETANGLACCFEYSSDLFEETTISRMADHWRRLLVAMVADPDQPVHSLAMLSEAELVQVTEQWSQQTEPTLSNQEARCMHQVFEDWVQQTPGALAAVSQQQQYTYKELNQRANQLAHYLQQQGVRPESCVGICIEKSLDMLVAVLGVLKAGGAYIPLDPAYPKDRLHYILCDSKLEILLTQQHLLTQLPAHALLTTCIDSQWPMIAQLSVENPQSAVLLDNLCYSIYTSGSTGHPKGVLLHHRGLYNLCQAQIQHFRLTPQSRVWQFASFSFDASVSEIFTTLGSGATLYIGTQDVLLPGPELVSLLRQYAITTLTCSPSTLAILPEDALTSLQVLVSAGEPCTATLVERWASSRTFLNAYGPTEATVCATIALCSPTNHTLQNPPIGKPIANISVYVLDEYMQPVPVGVPGELYIGGMGLARGYLGHPALTAERFVPHPFAKVPGERLYQTGDQACWLPTGDLVYLGRLDQQVKVRGYRIELGEVESVLHQIPTIRDAAVAVQGESIEDRYLTAYLVADANAQSLHVIQDAARGQMAEWQEIFDETFESTVSSVDPTFEIAGWNSSYTGQPLPAEDMHAWVDCTIARLQSLHPRRVLEIGCGSGLLLYRLLSSCEHYWGTDFSANVLSRLQQQLEQRGELGKVTLLQRSADNFAGLSPRSVDTIILNSVIQYFPSVEYLLTVLEGALQVMRPGGKIFVGDVRNLHLLEAFACDVELERVPANLSLLQMRARVEQRVSQENELLLDPAFFLALPERFPALSHIQLFLKRGKENELTNFRYDVVLHVGERASDPIELPAPYWYDWQADEYALEMLHRVLRERKPDLLLMTCIPNRRTLQAARAAYLLQTVPDQYSTVAELRLETQRYLQDVDAIDPEAIWQVGQTHNYQVEVSWSPGERDGRFDVILRRCGSAWEDQPLPAGYLVEPADNDSQTDQQLRLEEAGFWQRYANRPMEGRLTQQLIAQTREYLKERLPEYMVPSAYLVLPALPLSPNGKVDRRALPQPSRSRRTARYVMPRTQVEQTITSIWQEVLQVEQIGMDDNFFDLGGHSLRLAQLHSMLRKAFEKELSMIALFQFPTVRTQARYFHQPVQQTQAREQGRSRAQSRRELMERQNKNRQQHRSATKGNISQ